MTTTPAPARPLIDAHRRHLHKLRVQLTDACNFRCFYCMPKDARFLPKDELLSADEIVGITEALTAFGVDEVRLTGGEPTIRPEFLDITRRISRLPLAKLGLTTNGYVLLRHLDALRDTALRHINVSLDSLREERFNAITRSSRFAVVLRSIRMARDMGFSVKINCIMFRGRNDDELVDFLRFSESEGIEVRFLEYMRIGPQYGENESLFLSADEAIAVLGRERSLSRVQVPRDSTSFNFETDRGGKVGFIASESKPFCGDCSRLRLTATGVLRACLMSERGVSLRGEPLSAYPEILERVMRMKPIHRTYGTPQPMHEIGG